MAHDLPKRISFFLLGALQINLNFISLPAKAVSSLAAWKLKNTGILQLRTSHDTNLKAYFQSSLEGKGQRVWIDFPGELLRPRAIKGSGPVKEIRLGKPQKGQTRLVLEFKKSVSLDPSKLSLVGTATDKWELRLPGLSTKGLKTIGEGDLSLYSPRYLKQSKIRTISSPLVLSDLNSLPRNRYHVVIDPGHGGPDSGAVGIRGIRETDVVLDVSLKVARYLELKGVTVDLTRTSEIDLDLSPRVAMANRLDVDAFVSIHANASRTRRRDVNGIETFFYSGSRGLKLATFIQNQLLDVAPKSPDRGVRRGRFFVIRRTNMPAALAEIGFLTGLEDSKRLAYSSHRNQIALAIANGILLYLGETR